MKFEQVHSGIWVPKGITIEDIGGKSRNLINNANTIEKSFTLPNYSFLLPYSFVDNLLELNKTKLRPMQLDRPSLETILFIKSQMRGTPAIVRSDLSFENQPGTRAAGLGYSKILWLEGDIEIDYRRIARCLGDILEQYKSEDLEEYVRKHNISDPKGGLLIQSLVGDLRKRGFCPAYNGSINSSRNNHILIHEVMGANLGSFSPIDIQKRITFDRRTEDFEFYSSLSLFSKYSRSLDLRTSKMLHESIDEIFDPLPKEPDYKKIIKKFLELEKNLKVPNGFGLEVEYAIANPEDGHIYCVQVSPILKNQWVEIPEENLLVPYESCLGVGHKVFDKFFIATDRHHLGRLEEFNRNNQGYLLIRFGKAVTDQLLYREYSNAGAIVEIGLTGTEHREKGAYHYSTMLKEERILYFEGSLRYSKHQEEHPNRPLEDPKILKIVDITRKKEGKLGLAVNEEIDDGVLYEVK